MTKLRPLLLLQLDLELFQEFPLLPGVWQAALCRNDYHHGVPSGLR